MSVENDKTITMLTVKAIFLKSKISDTEKNCKHTTSEGKEGFEDYLNVT